MEQIGFLQLLKVAVYGFIVQCAVLRLQIVRNGFGREGIPNIVESVFHHSLQLVNLANLITLSSQAKMAKISPSLQNHQFKSNFECMSG